MRPYAVRKPKDYRPRAPGDLVQVDTADLRLSPGVTYKHFTARDVVSRWDVLDVAHRATAQPAARFLDTLQQRMPFPVRATHREEFYQALDPPASIEELRQKLRAWETVYNTQRPHQALGYQTPLAFYQQWLATHARERR